MAMAVGIDPLMRAVRAVAESLLGLKGGSGADGLVLQLTT